MPIPGSQLTDAVLRLARIAGDVANFCDHAEHNEATNLETVRQAADALIALSIELAGAADADALALYANRIDAIEHRNVLHCDQSFDGRTAIASASSWRDLQLAQVEHDRHYHPDVLGLTKADQLRHYALHLAKLAGAASAACAGDLDQSDFVNRRVADMLLFGIKLATVTGKRLSDEPLGADVRAPYLVA
jgi:hypothetical protein